MKWNTGCKELDVSGVKMKGAFLGKVTSKVRDLAGLLSMGGKGIILDVGCGNGLFLASLGRASASKNELVLVGVDRSMPLLKEAKGIFKDNSVECVSLLQGNALAMPFKRGSLDYVLMINTLLNMPDRTVVVAILRELMSLCKIDGKMVVDIRNGHNPYIRFKYWLHNRRGTFPTKAYRLDEICRIFEKAGFAVARKVPVGIPALSMAFAFVLEAVKVRKVDEGCSY